jgi:hypothetical protein
MARKLTTFGLVLGGLILVLAVVSVLVVTGTRRKADAFLQVSGKLVVGASTYGEAKHILDPYRSYVRYSEECQPKHCQLSFLFQNSWLKFLHLAPPTAFGGSPIFDDGVLSARITFLGQGHCCVDHITEGKALVAPADESSRDYSLVLQRGDDGFPWKGAVMLTPRATAQQRRDPYSFNVSCLSKLGGCKAAEELLPAIWKRN